MKKVRFLIILISVFLLASCGSMRKAQKTEAYKQEEMQKVEDRTETANTSEAVKETGSTDGTSILDAVRNSATEVTYTKVEFYPPDEKPEGTEDNTEEQVADVPAGTGVRKPDLHGKPDNRRGAVKSIETYTLKHGETAKGVRRDSTYTETTRETETKVESKLEETVSTETAVEEESSTEPAKDPYRWRYILGIVLTVVVVLVAAYFLLRKTTIFSRAAAAIQRFF